MSGGLEQDEDVRAALAWFATLSGDPETFTERLVQAQQAYRTVASSRDSLGKDPSLQIISQDVVAAYFAQAKSLLDDRYSFDLALASKVIPWVKQLGLNIDVVRNIPGASERAIKMLRSPSVLPDSAMLELVVASNYATYGFDVILMEEAPGRQRTPDIRLSSPESAEPIFVECKRISRGDYEVREQTRHAELFSKAAEVIYDRKLSVYIDVVYTKELSNAPDSYLADRLRRALTSPIVVPNPWKDEFGCGVVKEADLAAARRDIHAAPLYFGTKLARLLCGHAVRDGGYHLAAQAEPDRRDPRFLDSISFGSVVTWQCIAPSAIHKKARYIKTKLSEADRQLEAYGFGIVHMAMDLESHCESSDLRRERNKDAIRAFQSRSDLQLIYLHYLVPRISETQTWLVDETVDRFGTGDDPVPSQMIFPGSSVLGNELPAWKQQL
jgi:hypothetical protein